MIPLYIFNYIFKFLCVLATAFMVGYWMVKYERNDDLTLIEYKLLDDVSDLIYPELSICFFYPFLRNDRFNVTKDDGFSWEYYRYLKGLYNFDKFKDIEYDEVTINLLEYFSKSVISWKAGRGPANSTICWGARNCPYLTLKNNYNGFSITPIFFKCYGVEIKKEFAKNIQNVRLVFKRKLKHVIRQFKAVKVLFNYPNQIVRPKGGSKTIWQKEFENRVEMLEISSFDILKRRNKRKENCNHQWKNFDALVMKNHLDHVGCRPPYISQLKEFPKCNTSKEIKRAYFDGWSMQKDYADNPCQEMPTIDFKRSDVKVPSGNRSLGLSISYPFKGKIITQHQEVDVHTLIGNIGGYIGLFLGKI